MTGARRLRLWHNPAGGIARAVIFMHGTPRDIGALVAYTAAGLAFGVPFILMKLKRLELLIAIHFAIDAGMVLAP